ncbi:FtsX-like permease family protein [Fulvivirga sp. M361]|uniref:ABC transporter permease n=1 Tax=Fulvivirga sp. M361 TaxID=2594266 RepID=UPI00117B6E76|nr:ABC transporter permease [Fulvivirga sp. M361]TRX62638.1 FtsX-like permease family protein [Fulvivirga sp. M361]
MISNYLKITYRNLKKRLGFVITNVIGLSIGITCCLLLLFYVSDELSYDTFHENGDRIYRIAGSYDQGGDERNRTVNTTFLLGPELESIQAIEKWLRIQPASAYMEFGDKAFQEDRVLFADSTFFEVFSFPLIKGDPSQVLSQVNSIVISSSMAKKYFGNNNPMGQLLNVDGLTIEITGVMDDIPANSHFTADFVVSMRTVVPSYPDWILTNNSGVSHVTYILARNGAGQENIELQLDQLVERFFDWEGPPDYFLQPLMSIHLTSDLSGEIGVNGDITYVYIFITAAILILVIACINYTNLSIAQSTARSKEVGLRKVIGAGRSQLILQHLTESVALSLMAMIFGGLMTELLLPYFNQLSGKSIEQSIIIDLQFVSLLLAIGIIIGLIAGSYPAFYLSGFNTLKVIQGEKIKLKGGILSFRRILIAFQFMTTTVLIITTIFIYQQLSFIHTKKLGINPRQIVYLPLPTNEIRDNYEAMKTELLMLPEFTGVTASNNNPTSRIGHWRDYELNGENQSLSTIVVSHNYFETLETELKDGRSFSKTFKSDETQAYILNEAAVEFLELEAAIGTRLKGWAYTGNQWSQKDATIVGVVKDFHFTSFHTKIQPVIFSLHSPATTPLNYMIVRYNSSDTQQTLQKMTTVWNKYANGRPVDFTFMEEQIENLYQSEKRFLKVFLIFSIVAIVIACLGALGLISYTVSQVTRQIGIRKVLGAPLWTIVRLVNQHFFSILAVAFVIAIPISYYLVDQWLETFIYKIEIGWLPFFQAAMLIILLAVITTSFQSAKAALTNPVNVLKEQ